MGNSGWLLDDDQMISSEFETKIFNDIYRKNRLNRALKKMPDDYQRLAVLLYLYGLPAPLIAEVFGVKPQRIHQHIKEFRRRNGVHYLLQGY
jgi:DNA-directed RNA polymerase specialized sigma24 family protein